MGHKLSHQDAELYRRVDEVLHYIWDPIGICDEPHARDEYHSYVQRVFSMLKSSKDSKAISDYLVEIAHDQMGLTSSRKRAERAAEILLKYKHKILEAP